MSERGRNWEQWLAVRPRLVMVLRIVRGVAQQWTLDKVPRMAAAVAFYTLFSFTPVLLVSVALASGIYGAEEAQRLVVRQATQFTGPDAAEALGILLRNAPQEGSTTWATVLGLLAMFFGATSAFSELQDALDTIWEVKPRPGLGILQIIRSRILSFAMVVVIGLMILLSLALSTALVMAGQRVAEFLTIPSVVVESTHFAVTTAVVTLLFALVYKVLPDVHIPWRDVWWGALLGAMLFTFGKWLFSLYLAHTTMSLSFGASGSLVIMVLWTYYSCLILLFGAEAVQVTMRIRDEPIEPSHMAVRVSSEERRQQGLAPGSGVFRRTPERDSS